MVAPRHILMTVQYDRHPGSARSLVWIAPELKNERMIMTEDHIGESRPSRTWEGTVDGATFERFARAWRLPVAAPSDTRGASCHRYTLDGMNWEDHGEASIVCVSLEITPAVR